MERHILLICTFVLAQLAWPQSPTIVGYEYWFNEDHPGREYVAVAPGQVITLQDEELTVPEGLPIGTHTVHFRWKDVAPGGAVRWSTVVSRSFQKHHAGPWELVALRYWVGQPANDSDPSIHYMEIDPPQAQFDFFGLLDLCDFPVGNNQILKLQLLDNHGQWSPVVTRPVNIQPAGILGLPTITANMDAFCPGDTVILTATPPSGQNIANPTSYSWTVPEGNGWSHEPSMSNTITVVVGDGPGTVQVFGINNCGTSATASFQINLAPEPDQPSITGPVVVCTDSTEVFEVASVDGVAYTWSITGDGWSGTSSANTYEATAGSGYATIMVTPTNACGAEGLSGTLEISSETPPSISGLEIPEAGVTNAPLTFTIASVPGATYNWTLPPGWSPEGSLTGNEMTATPTIVGDVQVCVEVSLAACSATECFDVSIGTVGIEPLPADRPISIHPNPSQGLVWVMFDSMEEDLLFELFDATGRRVMDLGRRPASFSADLSGLASGTYVLSWRSLFTSGRQRVVLQH